MKKNISTNKNVFINCPSDDDYKNIFDAITFTVIDCGFIPRCTLEHFGGSENRLNIIIKLIKKCHLSIHDISRTQLDSANKLPRFNMPFELGIFFGAKHFQNEIKKTNGKFSKIKIKRNCLIMENEKYQCKRSRNHIR